MKTLKDLKTNAHKFKWALTGNSWSRQIPERQATPRLVKRVQSAKLSLLTIHDGEEHESWLDFPKASELEIKHYGLSVYDLIITRKDEDRAPHVMQYRLTPILELFN